MGTPTSVWTGRTTRRRGRRGWVVVAVTCALVLAGTWAVVETDPAGWFGAPEAPAVDPAPGDAPEDRLDAEADAGASPTPADELAGALPDAPAPPVTGGRAEAHDEHEQASDGQAMDEPAPEDEGVPEEDPEARDDAEEEAPVDVAEVQRRLRELGYLVGPADGVQGQQTTAAVMAFQRVNGLVVDGIVGPQTLGALEDPVAPELRGGPATRIEIDLTRQLLHLVEDGQRTVTLHSSSGNGQPYETASGGTAYGNTPVGEFVIERRIQGTREADLGTLYDPLYFYRGWAIHGSGHVPAHPASHGCIRITRADARWLFEQVPNGTPVHLYGGTHVFVPSG